MESQKSKGVMSIPRPPEPEPFMFSWLVSFYEWFPRPVRNAVSGFFFTLSPDVPVDLREQFKDVVLGRIVVFSALTTFFFCFVVTALLCLSAGTLLGTDPNRLYFLKDGWNIALYVLICPAYVAGGICIIVLTFQHWARVNQFASELAGVPTQVQRGRRLGLALVVILLICGLAISSYMYDSLNTEQVQRLYWFMEDGGPVRALNRAGYYYIALNFVLLFVTALAVFCFFSLAIEAMWVGQSLPGGGVTQFKVLRENLAAFTQVYLLTKFIAAVYMINTIIWKDSPLGGNGATLNILVAGVLLTIIGVFFIAVPRLYVELKWYEYKLSLATADPTEESFDDLRPRGVRLSSHLLDLLIIGTFISAFWGWDLNPLTWLRSR
jgi:hypothetical protein